MTVVLVLAAAAGGYLACLYRHQRVVATLRWILDLQAQRLDAALRPRPRKRHIPAKANR